MTVGWQSTLPDFIGYAVMVEDTQNPKRVHAPESNQVLRDNRLAEDYHHYLKHLLEKGSLPPWYKRNIPRGWDQDKDS